MAREVGRVTRARGCRRTESTTGRRGRLVVLASAVALVAILTVPLGAWSASAAADSSVTSIAPNTAPNAGEVSVSLTGSGFTAGCAVKLTRGDVAVQATAVTTPDPASVTCMIDLTGAAVGTWDVVVVNPDGYSGTLAGGFTVTGASESEAYEPNDAVAQAFGPLKAGTGYAACLATDRDADFYWLELPSGVTRFEASLKSIPYECDYDLHLLAADGGMVAASSHSGDTDESVELASPAAGRYYLKVVSWGGSSTEDSYLVSFTAEKPPAIAGISSSSGPRGKKVALSGAGFGSRGGGACVTFGSAKCSGADYRTWSNNRIVVRVPAGASGRVRVRVKTASGASNSVTFRVTNG